MENSPRAWLFSQGVWKVIDDPVKQGYRLEEWYDVEEHWGYLPVLLFEGKEGAPYPYALDVPQYQQVVYAADFPSYAQLLERLAPLVLAETLGGYVYERHWRWGRKHRKNLKKRHKKLMKAKAKALRPAG